MGGWWEKGSGESETGSLALVWTLWFLYTYALRSEVAEGMPLGLNFFMAVITMHSTQGMFNCGIFFSRRQ